MTPSSKGASYLYKKLKYVKNHWIELLIFGCNFLTGYYDKHIKL